jgi:site-specific DNA-methyltransferase (adenine-specific)
VLKPGGFFLFFCSPRLAFAGGWAANESGFEIRDMPVWEHEGGQGKSASHSHLVRKCRNRTDDEKNKLISRMTGLGTPQLRPKHEPFIVAQKPIPTVMWKNFEEHGTGYIRTKFDDGQQSNVFQFRKPRKKERFDHMTVKPLPLMERIVEVFSLRGQTVLDMCMGSGTTGEAAMRTNRKFIGIEIDEHSFDIACDRMREINRGYQ